MRLSDVQKIINDAGIPCYKWAVPEDIPLPHCCVAKISNGDNTVYADDGNYYPVAKCQMYAAMYDNDEQESTELRIDKALDDANIAYRYSMGYNIAEAIVVKIYTFEIPEEVTDNEQS